MENIDFSFTNPNASAKKEKESASQDTTKKLSVFTETTSMSVSGILHRGEDKAMCIFIEDAPKCIEIRITLGKGCEVLSNNGYSDTEVSEITEYINENAPEIAKTAKEVNPMKAFMA